MEQAPASAKAHDDVYEAVFALVGKQKTETYEDLAKVLPSIKDKAAGGGELKELAAREALREMFKPKIDPLREEYEKAAAEEDVDDLSTEDGAEWLNGMRKSGGEDDEVDEDNIPVMKLPRASSSFILDGPGDLKWDNFTVDGEGEGEAGDDAGPAGITGVASTAAPETAAASAAVGAAAAAAAASYVPSAIVRASAAATAGGGGGGGASVAAPPTAAAVAAALPVVTLEDELRAMRAARSAAQATVTSASQAAADGQQQGQGQPADKEGREGDDDDAPEIIPEPSGPSAASRRPILLYNDGAAAAAGGNGSAASGGGDDGNADGAAAPATAMAAAAAEDDGLNCLPGECQDTSREDAVWQAMHGGVSGQALLQHMGLAGSTPGAESSDDEAGAQASGSQPPPLANGHSEPSANGTPVAGSSTNGGTAARGGASRDSDSSSGSRAGTSGAGTAGIPTVGTEAAATLAAEGGVETTAGSGQELALWATAEAAAATAAAAAAAGSRSADGPVFEEVEKFSLDPDFDYDNVVLTRREFPYTMLGAMGSRAAAKQ